MTQKSELPLESKARGSRGGGTLPRRGAERKRRGGILAEITAENVQRRGGAEEWEKARLSVAYSEPMFETDEGGFDGVLCGNALAREAKF